MRIGDKLTRGLGAGGNPEIGRKAAERAPTSCTKSARRRHDLHRQRHGRRNRTGASPIVAQIAKELGALTIGVVTCPFTFEGAKRQQTAEAGIEASRARSIP
ncbi:MAG: hypothetical protein U0703_10920 [Anaerolineae bacterium]